MAGFKQHIGVSTALGLAYGGLAWWGGFTPIQAVLAGGLTSLGGMLPDLDADNGRPVREIANGVASVAPLMLIAPTLKFFQWPHDRETVMAVLVGLYLLIRYGLVELISLLSVHRGMFHSIPALIISAQCGFLAYPHDSARVRLLMGVGVGLGFLSHLLLDELWSVEIKGLKVGLKKSSGTAFKMFGEGIFPNVLTYALLGTCTVMSMRSLGIPDPFTLPAQRMATQSDDQLPQRPTRSVR